MISIKLDKNWTGKEALAIIEFLDNISDTIWKAYGDKVVDVSVGVKVVVGSKFITRPLFSSPISG